MGELIAGTFFTDKLRSAMTAILLVILIALICLSWAYPRSSDVSKQTLDTLKEVSGVMKDAAEKFEQQALTTSTINDTLNQQLRQSETERDASYQKLLKDHGLDPGDLYIDYPSAAPPAQFDLPATPSVPHVVIRMFPENNSVGSQHVPSGTGATGADRELQEQATQHSKPADGGDTPTERSSSGGTR